MLWLHPVLSLQVTLHGQVNLVLRPVAYSYSLFARSRYWRDSQERAGGDSRQLNTAVSSMETVFLGSLPTLSGCQEKMHLALQTIWPNSGLVLGCLVCFLLFCFFGHGKEWILLALKLFGIFLLMAHQIVFLHTLYEFVVLCVEQCVKKCENFRLINLSEVRSEPHQRERSSLCRGQLLWAGATSVSLWNVLSYSVLLCFDLNFNPGTLV